MVSLSSTFTSSKSPVITIGLFSLILTVICSINLCVELYQISIEVRNPGSDPNAIIGIVLIQGAQAIIIALLFVTFVDIVANVLMIMGTCKKIPGYIFPWLALRFVGIICAICLCIGFLIIIAVNCSILAFFLVFLVANIVCILIIYFWLVVYSHYKSIIAESIEEARPNDV